MLTAEKVKKFVMSIAFLTDAGRFQLESRFGVPFKIVMRTA